MINSLLTSIQNLIALSSAETGTVTSLFKGKSYNKGDFFLEEGRVCKHAGFVNKGLLRYYINDDGEEKPMLFPRKTISFVIMKAFFPNARRLKLFRL